MIDLQSGVIHAEERDYKTAYSYFFEAFEQLNNLDDDVRAVVALKYMLLCKVMSSQAEDVAGLIAFKGGLKHQGESLDAMKAVATACAELRSSRCERRRRVRAAADGGSDHRGAPAASRSADGAEPLRVIEPFSQVEIAHVAELIERRWERWRRSSAEILDGKFEGILDQGVFIVYDDSAPNTVYKATMETIANMDRVDLLMANRVRLSRDEEEDEREVQFRRAAARDEKSKSFAD